MHPPVNLPAIQAHNQLSNQQVVRQLNQRIGPVVNQPVSHQCSQVVIQRANPRLSRLICRQDSLPRGLPHSHRANHLCSQADSHHSNQHYNRQCNQVRNPRTYQQNNLQENPHRSHPCNQPYNQQDNLLCSQVCNLVSNQPPNRACSPLCSRLLSPQDSLALNLVSNQLLLQLANPL